MIKQPGQIGSGCFRIVSGCLRIVYGCFRIIDKLMNPIMFSIPSAVFLEAFLSFVGLRMPPGSCSLGTLLSDGFNNTLLHPYKLFPPAVIMIILMIACHMIAEGFKKATE